MANIYYQKLRLAYEIAREVIDVAIFISWFISILVVIPCSMYEVNRSQIMGYGAIFYVNEN